MGNDIKRSKSLIKEEILDQYASHKKESQLLIDTSVELTDLASQIMSTINQTMMKSILINRLAKIELLIDILMRKYQIERYEIDDEEYYELIKLNERTKK